MHLYCVLIMTLNEHALYWLIALFLYLYAEYGILKNFRELSKKIEKTHHFVRLSIK